MRKSLNWFLFVLFASTVLLNGCGSTDEEAVDVPEQIPISGKIYSIADNRILVVEGLEDVNIPQKVWFEQGKRAVYFAVDEDTKILINDEDADIEMLGRGQTVEIYHEGFLAESYPEQGKAMKVIVVDHHIAEEEKTDSGRITGDISGDLLEVKISGVPDEIPAKIFKLTENAELLIQQQNIREGDEIRFRYISDTETEGLIFDINFLSD
jgi:hypothetical protein